MNLLFIVNLTAGRGSTAKLWPELKKDLDRLGINYSVRYSEFPGHAQKIATELSRADFDGIVAVGGDGTVNEIANGIIGKDIPLGIIPLGTGNDLCRSLNIPQDPLEALIIIARGKTEKINTGKINDRYFLNVASIGLDASVAEWVNNNKIFKGSIAYYAALFFKILKNKYYKLRISLNNEVIEKKCTLIAIANGKYYGAGQKIAPQAELTDDYFDVVIVDKVTRAEIIKTLPKVKSGRHIYNPNVSIYKAKKVEITSEEILPIQIDGETGIDIPLNFDISSNYLKVFVP